MDFCHVESDLKRHLSRMDDAEARESELLEMYPLSYFEDDAIAELLANGFMEYGAFWEAEAASAAAERIAMFKTCPGLMPSAYATDGCVRDEATVSRFVSAALEEIQERMQREKINDPWIWNGVGA